MDLVPLAGLPLTFAQKANNAVIYALLFVGFILICEVLRRVLVFLLSEKPPAQLPDHDRS